MSVIIRGMKMPKNCWYCPMHTMEGFCNVLETYTLENQYIPASCPIIEIPEEHGRLVDADKLLAEAKRQSGPMTGDGWDNWGVYALIERQKTVVEAEDENETKIRRNAK